MIHGHKKHNIKLIFMTERITLSSHLISAESILQVCIGLGAIKMMGPSIGSCA